MYKKIRKFFSLTIVIFWILWIMSGFFTFGKIKKIIYTNEENPNFQKKTFNNMMSIWLVNAHLKIGLKLDTNQNLSILETIKQLEELALLDIIETLELSNNKEKTLEKFFSKSENTINIANIQITQLSQEVNFFKADISTCTQQKTVADQRYFESIKNYDAIELKEALEDASKLSICISENRVNYNAKGELLNKILYYYKMLENKYKYLDFKKDTIIKHFDIIKNDILTELNNVQRVLEYQSF